MFDYWKILGTILYIYMEAKQIRFFLAFDIDMILAALGYASQI